jgi:hypothetical protein
VTISHLHFRYVCWALVRDIRLSVRPSRSHDSHANQGSADIGQRSLPGRTWRCLRAIKLLRLVRKPRGTCISAVTLRHRCQRASRKSPWHGRAVLGENRSAGPAPCANPYRARNVYSLFPVHMRAPRKAVVRRCHHVETPVVHKDEAPIQKIFLKPIADGPDNSVAMPRRRQTVSMFALTHHLSNERAGILHVRAQLHHDRVTCTDFGQLLDASELNIPAHGISNFLGSSRGYAERN